MEREDLSGKTFGKLKVIDFSHSKRGRSYWNCLCECGNVRKIRSDSLKSGQQVSCGCNRGWNSTKHGKSKTHTKLYHIWVSLKSRVYNKNDKGYKNYGGRGIVCSEKWLTFEGFFDDMGSTYKEGLSIERIDTNGNYCKENCVWIELPLQSYNKTMRVDNTSGITGVRLVVNRWGTRFWVADWTDFTTGKTRCKYFSTKKFGEDEAKKMACCHRTEMIAKQVEMGAPYSEQHGLPKEGSYETRI